MDIPPTIKSFDHLIKEIKKPRREYEKKYIGTTKGYTINKKWKRREQAHDILCWLYTDPKIIETTLLILRQEYDNNVKIHKNPTHPQG